MPSEQHIQRLSSPPAPELQQQQSKACVACQGPLLQPEDDVAALLLLSSPLGHEALTLCPYCRQGPSRPSQTSLYTNSRSANTTTHDRNLSSLHVPMPDPAATRPLAVSTIQQQQRPAVHDDQMSPIDHFPVLASPDHQFPPLSARAVPIPVPRSTSLFIDTSPLSIPSSSLPSSNSSLSPLLQNHHLKSPDTHSPTRHGQPKPDPLVDITRIRMRTQPHHCLYPGSTFQGTQKSGRNSYDVTVTIVNVDFASSHLCGYLCIRGLTDDWPELTTYFDAELIGGRHGFRTSKWGATEEDDMVHWGRFPAFRHIKNKLKGPQLTTEADTGAVFMRWKERFLVPDHRVQDINGASFAGFYYVCVDFNSCGSSSSAAPAQQTPARAPPPSSPTRSRTDPAPKPETQARRPRAHAPRSESMTRPSARSPSGTRAHPTVATMSGFYFHQHSEPYQQLSLKHVPERISSSFELR